MTYVAMLLGNLLGYVLGKFVPKLLFALGIGYVSYQGADVLVGLVQGYISDLVGGMSPQIFEAWQFFGGDIALNMVFSAWTIRASLTGARKIVATGATS